MNSKKTEDKKEEMKKFILDTEQEIIVGLERVDDQQVVNRIVKHFEEISPTEEED